MHTADAAGQAVTYVTHDEYLTAHEVAAAARVSYVTALRWVRSERLPSIRISNVIRVRRSDLDAFLEAHRVGGVA